MKIFLNKILYGDSCSGKTYIFKKNFNKKIDIDYLFFFKKIKLKFEYFFRKLEKYFFYIIFKLKKIFFLGGGNDNQYFSSYLILKNNSLLNQKKRLKLDNFNRPTLKNNNFIKIRFCIRKKKFFKYFNIVLNYCYKCNIYTI